MKKILLSIGIAISLFAGEVEFGKGSFNMDASFLGLTSSKKENITSVSLIGEHKNIFSSEFFYSYKLSYFKSNTLTTSSNYLNSSLTKITPLTNSGSLNSAKNLFLIYNKLRGADLNVVLGKDFINKDDKDTYLGAGLLFGASFPYIKTSSNNNNNNLNYLKKSKTKFYTYKLGIDLKGAKAINKIVSFYMDGAYALQKARIKNSALNLDSSSSGDYMTFNAGVKLQAKTHTKIWFLNLSPNVFATLGYRYDNWKINDVKISSLKLNTDIKLKISQIYAGIGYDF